MITISVLPRLVFLVTTWCDSSKNIRTIPLRVQVNIATVTHVIEAVVAVHRRCVTSPSGKLRSLTLLPRYRGQPFLQEIQRSTPSAATDSRLDGNLGVTSKSSREVRPSI